MAARLTYWDGRGNAEIMRLTLAASGTEWHEGVALDDPRIKNISSEEQMKQLMSAGVLAFDQLPLLQIDGLNLVQKMATIRHIARTRGLYGSTPAEATRIDIVIEGLMDYRSSKPLKAGNSRYLPLLERLVHANRESMDYVPRPDGSTYFVGNKMSIADVVFFWIISDKDDYLAYLGPYRLLKALYAHVAASDGIASYMSSCLRYPRPGREGYLDRVKATIPWTQGLVERPPMLSDSYNWKTSGSEASMPSISTLDIAEPPSSGPARLTYWDGRGNAEIMRLVLAASGTEWVECVYGEPDTKNLSNASQMKKIMSAGVLAFDQLPLLEIDGLHLVQKMATIRHIARTRGLYGSTLAEATRIDIAIDGLMDYQSSKPALASGNSRYLPLLERLVRANCEGAQGATYFVGNKLSIADVVFFWIITEREEYEAFLEPYPLLKALYACVGASDGIAKYMSSDRRYPRPGREGYIDRVKSTIPWASDLVARPPMLSEYYLPTASSPTFRTPLKVVIVGGGPVALSHAIQLAEYSAMGAGRPCHVIVYERRIHLVDSEDGKPPRYAWQGVCDGNRRREQVVTLQNDVTRHFLAFSPEFQACFNGEHVWLNSQNVAIRDIEDRLLEVAQSESLSRFLQLEVGPPEDVRLGLRENPPNMDVYRKWLESLEADVVVAADGAQSFTRRSYDHHFQWTALGSTDPEHLVTTDYTLGIGLQADEDDGQTQALNTVLTLAQNRYLLNSEKGKRGYLNIRLSQAEYDDMMSHAEGKCTFATPCKLVDAYQPEENPVLGMTQKLRQSPNLKKVIEEGLRLFGLTEYHMTSIVAIPLKPSYAQNFSFDAGTFRVALIGDAAMSHHFWPGRGLNTGLKASCALARTIVGLESTEIANFGNFDIFMTALRKREMQGRSMSMLRKDVLLPAWMDELGDEDAVARISGRIDREAKEREFADGVKAWRDAMESRGDAWPHMRLTDAVIEKKLCTSVKRPVPLTTQIMLDSRVAVLDRFQQPTGRAGWPTHLQQPGAEVLPMHAFPDPVPNLETQRVLEEKSIFVAKELGEQNVRTANKVKVFGGVRSKLGKIFHPKSWAIVELQ